MIEDIVRRVLGGVQFVDAATTRPVVTPLRLSAQPSITWRRNAGGVYVVYRADGLDDPRASSDELFDRPPDEPKPETLHFECTVEDPSERMLSRRFDLPLPRTAPKEEDDPNGPTPALLKPQQMKLYRSTAVRPTRSAPVIYVFVHDGCKPRRGLPGARVDVTIDDHSATGITGPNGEALVEVVSQPSFSLVSRATATAELNANIRVRVQPALLTRDNAEGPWRLLRPPDPDRDFAAPEVCEARVPTTLVVVGRPRGVAVPVSIPTPSSTPHPS